MRWQTARPRFRRHIEPWDEKVKGTVSHPGNAYLKVELKILDSYAKQRPIQNSVKHLRRSVLRKYLLTFTCKLCSFAHQKLHTRYLTEFWIHHWMFWIRMTSLLSFCYEIISEFRFWYYVNLKEWINFYSHWKYQKTNGLPMISGGIEVN